eukprot:TRINITY_DN103240_c0_g1_i1.p1 TRINITY_DN103240_c0_g1~~TRINITY_DN103240_c0_g1_i1.p1  ORF type:complete len:547 (-),score=96.76 TRINITY_DN103240_c0_g1_i1:185-1825(-)
MIEYSNDAWMICMVCRLEGSVFPKAFLFAASNAILAAMLHWGLRQLDTLVEKDAEGTSVFMSQMDGATILWSGYTAVLGFLVVFRNNQAYARFWEGATLVNQLRGEWFNATSALMAFCTRDPKYEKQVDDFQQLLVRLMSVLYCSALQQICELDENDLEVLDLGKVDDEALRFLEEVPDRCQIIVQWLQRLIMAAYQAGTIKADAPILSRVFQELSRGMVNLNNVRKIKDIPFPYPYQQMVILMLFVHYAVTPIIAALFVASAWWAAAICFFVTGGFWSVIYIAAEIDQPFGDDPNDLPLIAMQQAFNMSLKALLDGGAQALPKLKGGKSKSGNGTDVPLDEDLLLKNFAKLQVITESLEESPLEEFLRGDFTRAISSDSHIDSVMSRTRSKDLVGKSLKLRKCNTVEMNGDGSVSPKSQCIRNSRPKRTMPQGGKLANTWRNIRQLDLQSNYSSEQDESTAAGHEFLSSEAGLPCDGDLPDIHETRMVQNMLSKSAPGGCVVSETPQELRQDASEHVESEKEFKFADESVAVDEFRPLEEINFAL